MSVYVRFFWVSSPEVHKCVWCNKDIKEFEDHVLLRGEYSQKEQKWIGDRMHILCCREYEKLDNDEKIIWTYTFPDKNIKLK